MWNELCGVEVTLLFGNEYTMAGFLKEETPDTRLDDKTLATRDLKIFFKLLNKSPLESSDAVVNRNKQRGREG